MEKAVFEMDLKEERFQQEHKAKEACGMGGGGAGGESPATGKQEQVQQLP